MPTAQLWLNGGWKCIIKIGKLCTSINKYNFQPYATIKTIWKWKQILKKINITVRCRFTLYCTVPMVVVQSTQTSNHSDLTRPLNPIRSYPIGALFKGTKNSVLTLDDTGVHSDLQEEYWKESCWFFRPSASTSGQRSVCFRNRIAWQRYQT